MGGVDFHRTEPASLAPPGGFAKGAAAWCISSSSHGPGRRVLVAELLADKRQPACRRLAPGVIGWIAPRTLALDGFRQLRHAFHLPVAPHSPGRFWKCGRGGLP